MKSKKYVHNNIIICVRMQVASCRSLPLFVRLALWLVIALINAACPPLRGAMEAVG